MVPRVARFLAHRGGLVLAVGVFGGLVLPAAAAALRPLLPFAVWGLLVVAVVRIDPSAILAHLRRPWLVAAALLWILVLTPAVAATTLEALGVECGLTTAVVLMAASPPIMSSPAFALLLALDSALMLVVMVAATALAPLTLPVIMLALPSLSLDVPAVALAGRMTLLIGSAVAVAVVIRSVAGRQRLATAATGLEATAVVLLLAFAFGVMDGVADRITADPWRVATVTMAAVGANLVLQVVTAMLFCLRGRRMALTLGFAGGNRNLALSLAVLPPEPDLSLFFAMGQIPIYALPALLQPVYRRLLGAEAGSSRRCGTGAGDPADKPGRAKGGR